MILSHPHHVKPPINREDCYAATHPSEHNSVFVLARSGLRREIREEEWKRRKVEEEAKMWKGKQTGKGMETEERYFRTRDHEFPFSSPVTMAHGYGCPHEKECYRGACAVVRPTSMCLPTLPCAQVADTDLGCIWMCRAHGNRVKSYMCTPGKIF